MLTSLANFAAGSTQRSAVDGQAHRRQGHSRRGCDSVAERQTIRDQERTVCAATKHECHNKPCREHLAATNEVGDTHKRRVPASLSVGWSSGRLQVQELWGRRNIFEEGAAGCVAIAWVGSENILRRLILQHISTVQSPLTTFK